MKMKLLFVLGLLSVSANAAITISGTAVTGAKVSDGLANIATGTLGLVIVDTAGDGFFNFGTSLEANFGLTTTNDPKLSPTSAGLSIGSTFGGETILSVLSSPGGGTFSALVPNLSIAGFEGKSFAVVWFDGVLASGAPQTAANGTKWGIVRGSDWVLPAADAGTFTANATDSGGATTYFSPNAQNGGIAAAFRTVGGTTFTVVPEPSAALLGAIGALGLLRRRRN